MLSSCGIIIRKPLGNEAATLGIRAAWAMFTNASIEIKLILMSDGVYSILGKTGYVKNLFEKFLNEGGEIYAVREDLEARGINPAQLPGDVNVVAGEEIYDLLEDTESVMTF